MIVQQSVALQIRGDVLKSKEVVYKVTCSNVEDIDEVWRDLRAWIGWKERLLGSDQRNFTQTWKKKGVLRWGAGSLCRQKYMLDWEDSLEVERVSVDYCAYDHWYHKPTHIWTNMKRWR